MNLRVQLTPFDRSANNCDLPKKKKKEQWIKMAMFPLKRSHDC